MGNQIRQITLHAVAAPYALQEGNNPIHLPLIFTNNPWSNSFGVEANARIASGSMLLQRAVDLKTGWVRLNSRISWQTIQPTEGGPLNWGTMTQVEDEMRALRGAGMTPIVIINDYPDWATTTRSDGQPSHCGPLRSDKYVAFAQFVWSLVNRYKSPEFNVHNWEIGNEPDVDPKYVPADSVFGCWGDVNDPYYNGRAYGEMLKIVGAAIKSEDPLAKVWLGGLLLASPQTTDPQHGRPELFLEGILLTGAAPYFDVVPYHWYPSYYQQNIDYDNANGSLWDAWEGGTIGKARYLKQLMQKYAVTKPVFLDETGLGCPNDWTSYPWCIALDYPDSKFFEAQANYIVRTFSRGFSENIGGYIWYTLNGPGWRNTGLLDSVNNPRPVYLAYQQLITRLQGSTYVGTFDYENSGIEAYAFKSATEQVHVLWAKIDQTLVVSLPQSKFVAAYTRDGASITPTPTAIGNNYQLSVGFSPIYIVRYP